MSTDLPEITERRQLTVGGVQWMVNEFNGGESHVLVATTNNATTQFSTHFIAGEWAEFQRLVSP